MKVTQKLEFVLEMVENIVGKGENAGNQHFLLFSQCFQKTPVTGSLCGKELKPIKQMFYTPEVFCFTSVLLSICLSVLPSINNPISFVGGFGKKIFVSTGVRKPGNTCASPAAMI